MCGGSWQEVGTKDRERKLGAPTGREAAEIDEQFSWPGWLTEPVTPQEPDEVPAPEFEEAPVSDLDAEEQALINIFPHLQQLYAKGGRAAVEDEFDNARVMACFLLFTFDLL